MLSSILAQNPAEVSLKSFSGWLDYFALNTHTTAADLELCRIAVGNRFPEMILLLARLDKLRPKVLADATYKAWLTIDNPKRSMPASDWTELFRLSYRAGHALFEVPDLN